jgi:hypothetical protein
MRFRSGISRILDKKQEKRLAYLLRLHSRKNEASKLIADEKAAILQEIFSIAGNEVELVELENPSGLASFPIEEAQWDPEEAFELLSEDATAIAKERGIFSKTATYTVVFRYKDGNDFKEKNSKLEDQLPEFMLIHNVRHEEATDEPELASLCRALKLPFPDPAKHVPRRSIAWQQPVKDQKPPRLSAKVRGVVDQVTENRKKRKSRPFSR